MSGDNHMKESSPEGLPSPDVIDLVESSSGSDTDTEDSEGNLGLSSGKRRAIPPNAEVVNLLDESSSSPNVTAFYGEPTTKRQKTRNLDTCRAIRSDPIDIVAGAGTNLEWNNNNSRNPIDTTKSGSIGEEQQRIRIVLDPRDKAILTPGIVEAIQGLSRSTTASQAYRWTCLSWAIGGTVTAQHIQQPDSWSCGYRNYQMMLSAVLPRLKNNHAIFAKLPLRRPPTPMQLFSVGQLQGSLEDMWQEGKDAEGAKHYGYVLKGKVGKAAMIGAMEVGHLCWCHGLDAVVLQFIKCGPSRKILPWFVWAYFASSIMGMFDDAKGLGGTLLSEATVLANLSAAEQNQRVVSCPSGDDSSSLSHLPLYLQWEGHSVTIVGIEVKALPSLSFSFLVLDPLKKSHQLKTVLGPKRSDLPTSTKLPWNKIQQKDLQVILCTDHSMAYSERQEAPRGRVFTAAQESVQRSI